MASAKLITSEVVRHTPWPMLGFVHELTVENRKLRLEIEALQAKEPVPRRFSALIGQSAILHWVETIFNRHTLLSGVCAHIAGSRRLFPI